MFEQHPALAGDLEAKLGRRAAQVDDIHRTSDGAPQRVLDGTPAREGVIVQQNGNIHVARGCIPSSGGGAEEHEQLHCRQRRHGLAQTTFQ